MSSKRIKELEAELKKEKAKEGSGLGLLLLLGLISVPFLPIIAGIGTVIIGGLLGVVGVVIAFKVLKALILWLMRIAESDRAKRQARVQAKITEVDRQTSPALTVEADEGNSESELEEDSSRVRLGEVVDLRAMATEMGILSGENQSYRRKKANQKSRGTDPAEEATQLIDKLIDDLGFYLWRSERKDKSETAQLRYHIEINGTIYFMKASVTPESGHFSLTLWNMEEDEMLLPIVSGETRQHYRLLSVAKEELRKWMKEAA